MRIKAGRNILAAVAELSFVTILFCLFQERRSGRMTPPPAPDDGTSRRAAAWPVPKSAKADPKFDRAFLDAWSARRCTLLQFPQQQIQAFIARRHMAL